MCLLLKRKKSKNYIAKVASKDIICYKLAEEFKGNYYGLYQNKYKLNEFLTEKAFRSEQQYPYINYGFHSFKRLKDAKIHINSILKRTFSLVTRFRPDYSKKNYVVLRCIIPKGSFYFKGVFGMSDYESYVSNNIKILKVTKI